MYNGSWKIDDLLTFVANTHTASTGAATDADAVPSYLVFEDETASPIISGSMAKLGDAHTVGFYSEQITLSAANGFEKGKSYNIYIQAAVAGVAGTMSRNFQVEAEVDANVVSDKTGYSLSTPQNFNLVGNISGTLSNVLNVINPVTAGNVTGSVLGDVNGSVLGDVNGSLLGDVIGNILGFVESVNQPVGISTGSFLLALADVVWDEQLSGHLAAGSAGSALNGAGSAGDPWTTPLPGAYGAGTAGHILASRMPTGAVLVGDKTGFSLSSPQAFNLIGNISGTITNVLNVVNPIASVAIVGIVTGSVGSVSNPVTVGTNNDKTGYSLSSPQNFNLVGNISGTLSNVLNVVNPVVAGVVTGSVLGNVNGSVAGSVGSVTSPVGISTGSFIDALVDRVWDEDVDSSHQTAGSAGKKLDDAGSAGDPWGTALNAYAAGTAGNILYTRMPTGSVSVGDKTGFSLSTPQSFNLIGNISGTLSNVLSVTNPVTAGVVTGSVLGNVNGSVASVTNPVGISTGTFIDALVDRVWDEDVDTSHQTAGSAGKKLDDASTGGDPWGTALPGAYGAGTAGNILYSRMPSGSVTVIANNDKTGYGLATGTLLDAISDKVWDETIAQHLSAGSTGEKLNSAASAGDPWTTALPGSYVVGTAGHILASRMPTGAVVVGTNQDKTGYSLSSPQNFNLIGNISGTVTTVTNLTNAGSTVISDTDMSTIAGRVWNSQFAPIRTLTTIVGSSIPPDAGEDVHAIRGDTFVWNIGGLDLGNLSKIQFSVKKKFTDVDAASLIFVETGTGLMWIDGTAATPANGAITYSQVSGTAQIRVEAVETAKLDVDQPLYYDVQIIRTTGTIVSSPLQGTFYITWDSTRSTS